jgi:pimeloyl-ACP methyl ester carboxylesterase
MSDPRNRQHAPALGKTHWEDRYWMSADGLKLHYREYAAVGAAVGVAVGEGASDRPPILCLAGLTRNARDFEPVAARLAGEWRVIAVDLRGRGKSEYAKDPMSYVPPVYVADILALLDELAIPKVMVFGTSLGGILAMLLAAVAPDRIVGALLNDIGPEIAAAGLARIRSYVGRGNAWPTWMHAARTVAEGNADVYPDYDIEDWLAMAKRLYRLNSSGRIVLDYDMKIAEPFRVPGNEAAADMWGPLDALSGKPVLIVRGGRSDILSDEVAHKMAGRLPGAELLTVDGVGHTPMLDEPGVSPAIDRLLAKIA